MVSNTGKKLKEIINMDPTIIKHPGSNLTELWINNVFICQGDNLYINFNIEDQAHIETYYPEDFKTEAEGEKFFTVAEEDLPFK